MELIGPSMCQFCILLMAFILLPLIPSILIYKIFPKDSVTITGPFNGLSINATGAFAGYFMCCLLLYPLVSFIKDSILMDQNKNYTWSVKAKVNLLKPNGQLVKGQELQNYLSSLKPLVKPDMIRSEYNQVTLYLPQSMIEESTIHIGLDGFMSETIRIEQMENAKKDNIKKTIDLGIVNLTQFGDEGTVRYNVETRPLTPIN